MDSETKKLLLTRLRYVAGQVAAIERMVASDRESIDVLHQLLAAQGGLRSAMNAAVRAHTRSVVVSMLSEDEPGRGHTVEQLMALLARLRRSADT
jgi:DNA-binding FrmR family transcriptional regulator